MSQDDTWVKLTGRPYSLIYYKGVRPENSSSTCSRKGEMAPAIITATIKEAHNNIQITDKPLLVKRKNVT